MTIITHSAILWYSQEKVNKMLVRELLELLSQLDGEAEVRLSQAGGEYESELSGEFEVEPGVVRFLD